MSKLSSKLKWQFFFLYCGVIFLGMLATTADNLFVNGTSIEKLAQYNFKAITVQAFCAVAIFQLYTLLRLRPPLLWIRLTRFPTEIFWAMIIFALVTSPLYHLVDILTTAPAEREQLWSIAISMLHEQTLCLGLAILLFTLTRRLLRPYVLEMPNENPGEFTHTTFMAPLLISFTSLLLIGILRPLRYFLSCVVTGKPIELLPLLFITAVTILYALILYILLIRQFRDELRTLIQGMLSLLEGNQSWLTRKMPIISTDEVGQLGIAFNVLQESIAQNYQEVQQEIQLAYQVQQHLLPPSFHQIGHYQVAATCLPAREVGGDLYDVVVLDESRFIIITGDVSGKGMPAALVMSAVIALVRAEVRRGGSSGAMLTRLNHAVVDTLQGNMFITLGMGIIDQNTNTFEYASAGHMNPYLSRDNTLIPLPCSSLPLGVDTEEVYTEEVFPLLPGDRIFLYTDGVIESITKEGALYGFTAFEASLRNINPQLPLADQVKTLLHHLPPKRALHDDDRTILVLKYELPDLVKGD